MLSSTNGLLGVAALASAATATFDVLFKDVVVVGGGASGVYAAIRLRDDLDTSVVVIEKEAILGGHVDSFDVPETGEALDFGVKTILDNPEASAFFDRLGIEKGTAPQVPTTTQYIDYLTGETVDFTGASFPDALVAMQKFLDIVEPWESLMQPSYYDFPTNADDIPADLLIPFGDFVTKHGLEDALPLAYSSTGLGMGNMTSELTMFVLQAFGPSMLRSFLGQQDSYVPASLRNQDLYDAAGEVLGDDVLYSSTVLDSWRTKYGVFLTVKNNNTGRLTLITARSLIMAIAPTLSNLEPFDLDDNEEDILGRFTYSNEFTGVIDNAPLTPNMSYFNLPASAAPANMLQYPEASFTARIDWLGVDNYFRVTIVGDNDLDASGAKELLQRDYTTLLEAGQLGISAEEATEVDKKVHWNQFSVHGALHARVSADEVRDGFFQKLYSLQGQRNTWWTGGSFSVNFQSTLWEYDDILIPMILESLN